MAFYHWMGPAMKATTEGKNEAQKIAEESALKKIQMQQVNEQILNAQQTRRFGEDLHPLEQEKMRALIAGQGLENTGKGYSNEQARMNNELAKILAPGQQKYGLLKQQADTKQAQYDIDKWNDPFFVQSQREELRKAGLTNQQIESQIAENKAQAAAARSNASANWARVNRETPETIEKKRAAAELNLLAAQQSRDPVKIEAARGDLNEINNIIQGRKPDTSKEEAPPKPDFNTQDVDKLRADILKQLQDKNKQIQEGNSGKRFWQKADSTMSEEEMNQKADEIANDRIVAARNLAARFNPNVNVAPGRTTKQTKDAAAAMNSPVMDRVLAQEAGAKAPTSAPVPQTSQTPVSVPPIPGVPPAIMRQVTPQDIQQAQQIVQQAQQTNAGSMSGMSQQAPTLAEAIMLIVSLKNQSSGPTETPTSGAMAQPGIGGRGFGRSTPVAF